jgi:hypothetical protein
MRASWVGFGGVLLMCAVGCGSATLSQDAGAGTTGHAGGSGGHGAAGTTGGGGSGPQGGAAGTSSAGTGGTLGAGGTKAQGGASGGSAGGNGGMGGGNAATGGNGGMGGTSGIGGQGAAGTAGHGPGGAGPGGTLGSGGTSGAGGTTTCTNTTADAANCGTCGHSCLGGQCAAGICQPFLLGSVPSTTEYAHNTVVSGGKVYVFTGDGPDEPSSVWQTDANIPGTPTEVPTNGTISCVMNGELFWTTEAQGTYGIASCTLANCVATTVPIVTLMSGEYFETPPGCDAANDEIVWASTTDGANYEIRRASPTGTNVRTITSVDLVDDSWGFEGNGYVPGETVRIFYDHFDFASGTDWIYYISTSVLNAASVQIAEVQNLGLAPGMASAPLDLANDTVFLANEYSSSTSTYSIFSVPLPNGILSGAPPLFTGGYISGGVLDETTFYGTIWANSTIPQDAVIKCPISDCSAPTIITRGQTGAINFADDGTAIYWTTSGQASNVAIWKAAK